MLPPPRMSAAGYLTRLVQARRPVYLVATRHTPATYFGAVAADKPRSSVFVFEDPALARDVALGLEHARDETGAFPPLDLDALDLDACHGRALQHLDIRELTVSGVLRMVRGSGLAVSFLYADSTDTTAIKSVNVMLDSRVNGANPQFLERVWAMDVSAPHAKAAAAKAAAAKAAAAGVPQLLPKPRRKFTALTPLAAHKVQNALPNNALRNNALRNNAALRNNISPVKAPPLTAPFAAPFPTRPLPAGNEPLLHALLAVLSLFLRR